MSATAGGTSCRMPHVLTIAGSDSGAGAGIQADIKTCASRGVYCSSVITAVTAEDTVGVQGVHVVPEALVLRDQLRSVLSDMKVGVVKTGMLPSVDVINFVSVVERISSPSEKLLPLAANVKEASALLGALLELKTVLDMREAAKAIHGLGSQVSCSV